MTRRSRALRYGVCLGLVFAGLACSVAVPGGAGGTICTGLVGVGLVGVMSLIFYEVGLSEDRDRGRAAAPPAPGTPSPPTPSPGTPSPSPRARIRRPRSTGRMRDHPRRLR